MSGHNLDVVQEPQMVVTFSPHKSISQTRSKRRRRRRNMEKREDEEKTVPGVRQVCALVICVEEVMKLLERS